MMTSCGILSKKPWISASRTTWPPLLPKPQYPLQGHVTIPSEPKPERILMEQRFEDGRHKLPERFLCNPVAYRWNPQGTQFAFTFGNEYATQRFRLKRVSRFEVAHRGVEVLFDIGLEHPDADLIHPSRALIALDILERLTHKFRGDSASQRMSFWF